MVQLGLFPEVLGGSLLPHAFRLLLLLLLLLLLSRVSRVQLCATPYMAAHEAPPSLGFSRQELWSGLPFPSRAAKSEYHRLGG